jgi:hypothetical protein
LTEAVRGRVITSSDSDYDDARVVYNAMHERRPRAIIQRMGSADVMAAVAPGRDTGFDPAIRGGGHSVSGFGTVDDGLVAAVSSADSLNKRAAFNAVAQESAFPDVHRERHPEQQESPSLKDGFIYEWVYWLRLLRAIHHSLAASGANAQG